MPLETALVVDDSKLARITLTRLLERHGLRVSAAESGPAALALLGTEHPDIIFMDHLMPDLDGFETTKKIREQAEFAAVPIIMCSGKEGLDDYHAQALAIGANDTLAKPPQPDLLQQILDTAAASASSTAAPLAPVLHDESVAPETTTPPATGFGLAVEGLQSRLEWLEEQLQTLKNRPAVESSLLQQALEQRDQKIRELQARLEDLNREAIDENMQTQIVEASEAALKPFIQGQIHQVEEDVQRHMDESLSESRKDLDAHINSIEARVTERATTLAQLQSEQHLLRQDTRFETLQEKFDQHIQSQRELSERLREAQAFCKNLQEQIEMISRQQSEPASEPAPPAGQQLGFSLAAIAIILSAAALAKAFGLF